ncbi:MAG: DUF3848 domain-containing protein [bacterium]|nr:DUF3848 domain-containing protein [bacterium]
MKEIFCIRLQREYLQFQESMLKQDKLGLYGSCFCISVHRDIYEVLYGLAVEMPESELEVLYGKDSLLEWLYETWMKTEDSYYEELKAHVEAELLRFRLRVKQGKEDGIGGGDKESKAADGGGD